MKLYQYSSGNVEDIVQRHTKYDGEKDTRGPSDFATGSAKLDDAIEMDEDDIEEEEEPPAPPPVVKGKAKAKNEVAKDEDVSPSHARPPKF